MAKYCPQQHYLAPSTPSRRASQPNIRICLLYRHLHICCTLRNLFQARTKLFRPTHTRTSPHLFALLHVCKKTKFETAEFHLSFSLNTFAFPLLYRLSAYYVHLTPKQLASITSIDVEVKLGTTHGIAWFIDGWKARGMNCLQDVCRR
jgi:hypothetical protein